MGYLRIFKRVRIAPGLTMNLSKSGPSLSFGVRGAHVTVGKSGVRRTHGLPGTGIFYTSHDGWHSGAHTARPFHEAAPPLTGWGRILHGVAMVVLVFTLCVLGLAILGAFVSQ